MIIPRDYQKEGNDAIFYYFQSGNKGNPLVVAPTGSGKTIMISLFCYLVAKKWPNQKVLIISHVKEILRQDYTALKKHLKNTKIGLYSAGLKSKTISNITVAGIQSIYNKPELFDDTNIILVDEAHTVPFHKKGVYKDFFAAIPQHISVIGYTATPFRLGDGYLHLGESAFFDEIVYTIPIKKLQREGYLCKLTAKGTEKRLDSDGVKKLGGDFMVKELALAFDREAITKDIVGELLLYKEKRKKWLLFAIDIDHCEHVTEQLKAVGIFAACVHSKKPERENDSNIELFKSGYYQCLVSVAKLTTGFDVPEVDLIGLLRPTASPVLHVQIIGRGLRPVYAPDMPILTQKDRLEAILHGSKPNCLVLDFAGNLMRNGPIDAPVIKLKGKGGGEAIMKECPDCFEIVHAAVRTCPACDTPFQFRHKLSANSKDREVLSQEEWHPVTDISYSRYIGSRKIPMLKVTYECGLRSFSEYICLEHGGYAANKARHWWSVRSSGKQPLNSQHAVELSSELKVPSEILINEGGKYDTIKDRRF